MLLRYMFSVLLALLVSNAVALKLTPLPGNPSPPATSNLETRSTMGDLDLQDVESFFWGTNVQNKLIYANLTAYFPEKYRYILGMDRFVGKLKSVKCEDDMMLEFNDDEAFAYAKKVWNWVNEDTNHTFIMVTNYEGCADDHERKPFVVENIRYDEVQNKAFLTAHEKEWEEILHSYTLSVGHMDLTPNHRMLMARGLMPRGPDFTMSLASGFDKNLFSTTVGGWTTSVDAVVRTAGSLNVDIDIDVSWFSLKSAAMKVSPENVAASIQLALTESGTLAKAYDWKKTIISIPIEGIEIAKVIKLGAFLDVDVGFTMEEWTGTATANLGARMELSNSATVVIDLVNSKNNKFSGWTPTFSPIPLTLSAKIEGSAKVYAEPNVKLEASALGKGWNVGLNLQMPYIKADFAAMADTTGVCGTKKTLGVDVDAKIGVELHAQAATKGNEANPFWQQQLYTHEWDLFSKCMAFGPDNAKSGEVADPNPASKTKSKSKTSTKATKTSTTKKPTSTKTTKTSSTTKSSHTSASSTKKSSSKPSSEPTPTKTSKSSSTKTPTGSKSASGSKTSGKSSATEDLSDTAKATGTKKSSSTVDAPSGSHKSSSKSVVSTPKSSHASATEKGVSDSAHPSKSSSVHPSKSSSVHLSKSSSGHPSKSSSASHTITTLSFSSSSFSTISWTNSSRPHTRTKHDTTKDSPATTETPSETSNPTPPASTGETDNPTPPASTGATDNPTPPASTGVTDNPTPPASTGETDNPTPPVSVSDSNETTPPAPTDTDKPTPPSSASDADTVGPSPTTDDKPPKSSGGGDKPSGSGSITTPPPSTISTVFRSSSSQASSSSADVCDIRAGTCKDCKDSTYYDAPTREYFAMEVDGDGLPDTKTNATAHYLFKRATRFYKWVCDGDKPLTVTMAQYPTYNSRTNNPHAITISGWYQAKDSGDCLNHGITTTAANPPPNGNPIFAAEHIYEGNWIVNFLKHLHDKEHLTCPDMKALFFSDTTTNNAGKTWVQAMMESLGSNVNQDLMVFLKQNINGAKFRMFMDGNDIIGERDFTNDKAKEKMEKMAVVGRAIDYMAEPHIGDILLDTAKKVEDTLNHMAAAVAADANLKGKLKHLESGTTLAKLHRSWLNDFMSARNAVATKSMIRWAEMASKAYEKENPGSPRTTDAHGKVNHADKTLKFLQALQTAPPKGFNAGKYAPLLP